MTWLKKLFGYRELTPEETVLASLENAALRLTYKRIPDHERRAVNNLIGRLDATRRRLSKEWGL